MNRFQFETTESAPYKIHQLVKSLFPDGKTLYRVDGTTVIAHSQTLPQNSVEGILGALKTSYPVGASLKFTLRVNPTKRLAKTHKIVPYIESIGASEWIHRQGAQHGFELGSISVIMEGAVIVERDGKTWPVNSVDYQGTLKVTSSELFEEILINGLGREKFLGFGMFEIYEV